MATQQSITSNGQRLVIPIGANITNVSIRCKGTFAGINASFMGTMTDPRSAVTADWFPTDAVRSSGNVVETTTGVLGAAPAFSWDIAVGGYEALSILSTAYTSGTQVWEYNLYEGGVEASPVIQSHPVTLASTTLTAGSALIGDVGLQARGNATGAGTPAKISSAASTNATVVKASAGRVLGWSLTNTTAAVKVFRLYDLATTPSVGISVPTYNIVIPPNGHVASERPVGIGHTAGISYSITGAIADTDSTVTAVGDVIGVLVWA